MDEDTKLVIKVGTGVVIIACILTFFFSSVKFLSVGEKATVFNRFTGVMKRQLSAGINFVNPITAKVKKFDIKLQKEDWKKVEGMSSDNQIIWLDLVINYRLPADKLNDIYEKIQGDIRFTVFDNMVYEIAKTSLGKFKIEEIARNREDLKKELETRLKESAAKYYIIVENVSIYNVDYSDDYNKAVEKKLVAQQKAQEAEFSKQAKIREAEGVAQSNTLIRTTVTDLVLRQKWIERWDGQLPTTIMGNNASALLQIK